MDPLISFYQERLNLREASFQRIEHEDAIIAVVYRITPAIGNPLILKVCPQERHYLREVCFLSRLAGKVEVPRILQVIEREPGFPAAILMECLPGTLLKIAEFTDEISFEMGALLARVHQNREKAYGDLIQPLELSADPRVYFAEKFEEGLAECGKQLPQALIDSCRDYFKTHLDLLDSVDGPCIVHRDFRPGNVLVCQGKIAGVIDWSSGRAGFAEEDFVHMEHAEWLSNPRSKKPFLAGYASIRPLPSYEAIMPLLRLSAAIAIVGFALREGTWNSSAANLYQCNRKFLESFPI